MDDAVPDLLHGEAPLEFAQRIFAVSPLAVVVLVLVAVGAFGAFWLYRKGRQDEREAFRFYYDLLRRRDGD